MPSSIADPPDPRHRNLVVMRTGDHALLPAWPTASRRDWDLALSHYGDARPDWGQRYFDAAKGPKWRPIHRWLSEHPEWLEQYDYIWFPDDDLRTDWDTVNRLFQICRDYDLLLAQPALTGDSYLSHAVTQAHPHCLLRFTVFVEVMAPVFRSDALRRCLPVMQEDTQYGWGHDWVFPKLLGYPGNKIAIIDACAMTHTRPAGLTTDRTLAEAEMRALSAKYGAAFMDHRVRGCLFREPQPGVFQT